VCVCWMQVCGKMLSSSFKLVEHIRVHTGEKPYCCEHCGCRFARREAMKQHKQMHLGLSHLCPICGKTFPSEMQQKVHTRRHALGRQFPCDLCDAKFLSSSSRSRHMSTHTNRKPHCCTNCGAVFRREDHLRKHAAKMHGGELVLLRTLSVVLFYDSFSSFINNCACGCFHSVSWICLQCWRLLIIKFTDKDAGMIYIA